MYYRGDFHIHSNESDGRYSPVDLIDLSIKSRMDIISITDHDAVSALDSAIYAGERKGLKVIPGIELSTRYNHESIHILGYFHDDGYNNPILTAYLKDASSFREERAIKIVERLKEYYDIKLDYNKIYESANGIIARPHIAKAIIDAGYSYSWDYIFHNLIGENSPAYVPNRKLSTEDGIKLLKSVNALVVLAHPVLIKNTPVNEIISLGFGGIEAIYFLNTASDTNKYLEIAYTNNLIVTAGSDFHGMQNEDGKHAERIGTVYLEENNIHTFLDKLNSVK